MQRAVDNPHLDAVACGTNERSRKAGQAIIDVESDAGLGRSVSVTDIGMRKHGAQGAEGRLVGDLAREPNIARRNAADRRTHQHAPPM